MITVTDAAKVKFTEILDEQSAQSENAELAVRIVPSQQVPNSLEFVLDQPAEGDKSVDNTDGRTVLVVADELAEVLNGVVLDFGATDQGEGFSLAKPEAEA